MSKIIPLSNKLKQSYNLFSHRTTIWTVLTVSGLTVILRLGNSKLAIDENTIITLNTK